jgi:hypothetical protein
MLLVSSARRPDLIAVSILVSVTTLLFADVIAGTHNLFARDLAHYYYPMKHMLREIVLAGEFPYWTRIISGGQPLAANPEHEVFYPGTWLLFLPDYFLGFRLHILVHFYAGILGMYALLRSMQLRAIASFAGAVAFGLGGVYMSYVNLLPILFSAAWLPLTLLFTRSFLLDRRLRWFALAALSLGMQFLVGEPTTVMQTGFLMGMYALYRGWYAARDEGRSWRAAVPQMAGRVGIIGLISIAAFAVGAAQMLPALDFARDTVRVRGFGFDLVSTWSMPWQKLLELIYPNVLGHISGDGYEHYWGKDLYTRYGPPFLFKIYPGLVITAFAAAALWCRRRGSGFVLLLCSFSFLFALGSHTPLLRFLFDLGITSIRYPEKFALIGVFAMTVSGSQALQRVIDGDDVLRRRTLGILALAGAAAAVVVLIGLTPLYAPLYGLMNLEAMMTQATATLSHRDWISALLHAIVLFGIVWALPRVRRRLWAALLGVFVVGDLAPVALELNPRLPASYFKEEPEIAASLPQPRSEYRVFHEANWYMHGSQAQRYFASGPARPWVTRAGMYPLLTAGYGFQTVLEGDYDGTALLVTEDFMESLRSVHQSGRRDWWRPYMAMSNAWFRAVHRDYESEMRRIGGDMLKARPVGFIAAQRIPRYYFSDQIVTVRDRHEFAKRLSEESWSNRVAFVRQPSFVPAGGIVSAWKETANTATIDVQASGRAFLVMSVTAHKYWRITIDGTPAEPIITNIAYQGVVVPKGRHRIEMRYRNPVVPIGIAVSLASTILLIVAASVPRRRRSSTHEPLSI